MDILKGIFKEFGWLVWGIFGLALLWFFTGGAENYTAHQGPYLRPPAPLSTGEGYGGSYIRPAPSQRETLDLPAAPGEIARDITQNIRDFFKESEEVKRIHATSLLSKTLYLDGVAGAKADNPQAEYIRIIVDKKAEAPVTISGLTLKSGANNKSVVIPSAENIPILGTPHTYRSVTVPPGGRVIITSGRSPIGTSFRVNMCSAYLGQFQTLVPELKRECPDQLQELKQFGPYDDISCRTFVIGIPKCETPTGALPPTLSSACRSFVTNHLNYNGCALAHKDDTDFYKDEWRIFLNQSTEIWKNKQEIIRLLDVNGNTIDAITY